MWRKPCDTMLSMKSLVFLCVPNFNKSMLKSPIKYMVLFSLDITLIISVHVSSTSISRSA